MHVPGALDGRRRLQAARVVVGWLAGLDAALMSLAETARGREVADANYRRKHRRSTFFLLFVTEQKGTVQPARQILCVSYGDRWEIR